MSNDVKPGAGRREAAEGRLEIVTAQQRYLTKEHVADLLNVTTRTVDNLMKNGWLVYHKIGRTVRFHMADVEKYMNERSRVCRK